MVVAARGRKCRASWKKLEMTSCWSTGWPNGGARWMKIWTAWPLICRNVGQACLRPCRMKICLISINKNAYELCILLFW